MLQLQAAPIHARQKQLLRALIAESALWKGPLAYASHMTQSVVKGLVLELRPFVHFNLMRIKMRCPVSHAIFFVDANPDLVPKNIVDRQVTIVQATMDPQSQQLAVLELPSAIYIAHDMDRTRMRTIELCAGIGEVTHALHALRLPTIAAFDIDINAVDAETFQADLNANAFEAGTMTGAGVGTELVESAGDSSDPATVDTALVDDDSGFTDDAARDGSDTDRSFVEVSAANVSVVKSSLVVSDPVNGTTNPKAIPGAVIRYCIAVSNSDSGATATGVTISDALPGEVDFNTGTIERNVTAVINSGVATCTVGSGSGATDSLADSDGGGYDSGTNTVSGTLDDVAAGATEGFVFEVTIAPAVTGTDTDTVTAARDTAD